jgi:type IV secretory pathway VirB9-like protein
VPMNRRRWHFHLITNNNTSMPASNMDFQTKEQRAAAIRKRPAVREHAAATEVLGEG